MAVMHSACFSVVSLILRLKCHIIAYNISDKAPVAQGDNPNVKVLHLYYGQLILYEKYVEVIQLNNK